VSTPIPIDLTETRAPALWRRLAAILYDSLLLLALMMLAAALVVIPLGAGLGIGVDTLRHHPLFRLYVLVLVPALFFCGFWMGGGQTLGMRAWRIRLLRADGTPVTLGAALLRLAAALLSWGVLGFGFIWCLVDHEGLAWHDRLSGTRLVMLERRSRH
jgi:uncharacterized RDD family membrane protein YckC